MDFILDHCFLRSFIARKTPASKFVPFFRVGFVLCLLNSLPQSFQAMVSRDSAQSPCAHKKMHNLDQVVLVVNCPDKVTDRNHRMVMPTYARVSSFIFNQGFLCKPVVFRFFFKRLTVVTLTTELIPHLLSPPLTQLPVDVQLLGQLPRVFVRIFFLSLKISI